MPVICDDFGDDTSMGDHWTATASAFPTSSWPNRYVVGLGGQTLAQYDAVGWLTLQILNLPTSVQPANALTQQVYRFLRPLGCVRPDRSRELSE